MYVTWPAVVFGSFTNQAPPSSPRPDGPVPPEPSRMNLPSGLPLLFARALVQFMNDGSVVVKRSPEERKLK